MDFEYKPPEDFVANSLEQLDDTELSPSDEILLFELPLISLGSGSSYFPEIEGGVLKIDDLDKDGKIGGFEDSSGTEFDLVSYASQDCNPTLIIASEESKIAMKISRRVSVVRYPEPHELVQMMKAKTRQKHVGAETNSSGKYSNPTQSSRHKSGKSKSVRHSASSRSSRQKSVFSGFTETPKSSKRKHSESSSGKHGSSTGMVSGSSERSGKSKKKTKIEG